MNVKHLIAAVLILAPALSQLAAAAPTREEVTAELYRARASGELCGNEAECDRGTARMATATPVVTVSATSSPACRNEAECDAAPRRDFSVTRAQVLAELYRARAAGEVPVTEADVDIGHALQHPRAN